MSDVSDAVELFARSRDARARQSWPGALDRYREFRQLFLGSDLGQRVLGDLLCMCRDHQRTAVKGDPYETYFNEGQRSVGLSILLTLEREPTEPPKQQQTREKG